jgi:broad specificity phosphatase PhoE
VNGRLILVRHGESEGNATRTFTHSPEVPLTDPGREQARRSGEVLRDRFQVVRLISSPFRRAHQTAEIISAVLSLPIEVEEDVREQHLGELHGQPYESALASPGFSDLPVWEWRPPGGETLCEVRDRAVPVIERVARAHPTNDVAVVCHGGTIVALWSHVAASWEKTLPVRNGDLLVVRHDGERFSEPELLALDEASPG